MKTEKCGWKDCKFNDHGLCHQTVHYVSKKHPMYEVIYNRNAEEIKKNCRCLDPDLGQYVHNSPESTFKFRNQRVSFEYHWLDDNTFIFQFGDGELTDPEGDNYFLHFEYHLMENKWIITIWWENENICIDELDQTDVQAFITREEILEVKKIALEKADQEIEKAWNELEDVLFFEAKDFFSNDDDYKDDITLVLASDWHGFDAGTSQETIWRWFSRHHSEGLSHFME